MLIKFCVGEPYLKFLFYGLAKIKHYESVKSAYKNYLFSEISK